MLLDSAPNTHPDPGRVPEDPGYHLPSNPAEAGLALPLGVVSQDPALPTEQCELADLTGGADSAEHKEIPIDEDLLIAVEGLFDRLNGRVRVWQIVYRLHGQRTVSPTKYRDLMDRIVNLRQAGLVVNVAKGVFVPPDSPEAIEQARRKQAKLEAQRAEREARFQGVNNGSSEPGTIESDNADEVENRPPRRRHRQTAEELEAMMREEFGGSNGKSYRGRDRERRRRSRS